MSTSNLPTGFVELANQRYLEARRFWGPWRGKARDDYAFISGDQWLADDEAILRKQKRPPITFNYSEKMIDAVVGAEVSNRQEITYAPRKTEIAGAAELMTNACKWVRDQGNIEDEETDAFRDALICGLGWTHTKVSFEHDPAGMIETHRIDPLEMSADPTARKPGLSDRHYSFRDMWIDERVAKKQWPSAVGFGTTPPDNTGQGVQTVRQGHHYEDGETDSADSHAGQVCIRHYECYELEPYFRVQLDDGQMKDVDASTFAELKKGNPNIASARMQKRVYYYAYFANETLLEGDLSPTQAGFTYQCVTGKRDRNTNTWYGLTKVMKDPQRWANKWLSQILHIINSNAKGGLIAEANAFLDPKKAQEEWASPESITWLKEGGIAKVEQKTPVAYPSGLDRLMEFALASLPQVTGINLEALGLASREQANVLEQSRKQAAYGLLAPVFDSLRRYRKMQGRVLADFIQKYISDGRMIRIGGPESKMFVPLTRQDGFTDYDIIVDQSPTAPDVKRDTWQALENLIPAAMKAGIPIPPSILKYAPIPTALALEWQQMAQAGLNRQSPEQMQKMQEQLQQDQQTIQQLQQQLKDKQQEMALKVQTTRAEMAMKQQQMVFEHQQRMAEIEEKGKLDRLQFEREHALNVEKAKAEVVLKKQQIDNQGEAAMVAARSKPKAQPKSGA